MKYEKIILEKFTKFNLKPRDNQVDLINTILISYLDNKNKYVVLSSPTGTGKSIVAVIVSECLYDLDDEKSNVENLKKSFILMQTNVLVEQYRKTFSNYSEFIQIMGSSNYDCSALKNSADNCIIREIKKEDYFEHCVNCKYMNDKKTMNRYEHLITNYSYYFLSTLYTGSLKYRLISI